jgi:hypothetical protein
LDSGECLGKFDLGVPPGLLESGLEVGRFDCGVLLDLGLVVSHEGYVLPTVMHVLRRSFFLVSQSMLLASILVVSCPVA